MMIFLLAIFFILILTAALINFRLGTAILILLLPAYLIRFSAGPLPSTLLELVFGAVFLVWLFRYARADWPVIKETIARNRLLFLFIFLFFAGSLIAAFTNPLLLKALGLWRAHFLEPAALFFVLIGRQKSISARDLIKYLAWSTVSISALAIVQKLTGQFYPPSLWDDQLSGRATAFFTTPNAIGLYLAPVILLATATAAPRTDESKNYFYIIFLALLAVFFSFSQGAWVALGLGAVLFAFLTGYKKTALAALVIGLVTAFAVPQIRSAVLFQDQAGQNRLALWSYSLNYVTASPKNFFLGSGMRMFFNEVQRPYYNVEEMERLIYPHNLFLNFWLETGLLGMISFTGLLVCLFILGAKTLRNDRLMGAAIIGALAVFVVHGLVDVPYFKNDLAMLFWIITALIVSAERKK